MADREDGVQTRKAQLPPPDRHGEHRIAHALVSRAAGALALTAVHQLARRRVPNAPRMDVVGMRAIARGLRGMGIRPPADDRLYRATLAGDLVSNTLYYAAAGFAGRDAVQAGTALGLGAGVGALALPPVLGLGLPPHVQSWANRIMTIAWYTLGGLVAGATYRAVHDRV